MAKIGDEFHKDYMKKTDIGLVMRDVYITVAPFREKD